MTARIVPKSGVSTPVHHLSDGQGAPSAPLLTT
jgi:hypothetical protein